MNIIGISQKDGFTLAIISFKPGLRTLSYRTDLDEKILYPINFPWLYFKLFIKSNFKISYFFSYISKEPYQIINNLIQIQTASINFPNLVLQGAYGFSPCMGNLYQKLPDNFSLYDQLNHYFDHYFTSEFTGQPVLAVNQKYHKFWELNEQFPFHEIQFQPATCHYDHVGDDALNFAKDNK